MKIKQNFPEEIDGIDPGIGTRETVPSHIMTAHGSRGGVLTADHGDGRAVSLVTPSMDREKAVMLSWTGVDSELEPDNGGGLREGYLRRRLRRKSGDAAL
jgi:hypothetical protein